MKKREDGRFRKKIVDERTGKTLYFYGETEREVLKKLLEYETEQLQGKPFNEVADDWWSDAQEYLAVQSIKSYRSPYNRAVAYFGSKSVKKILPKDVTVYLRSIARDGLTEKRVRQYKLVLNLIMSRAVEENYIDSNPCLYAQMPKAEQSGHRSAAGKSDEEIVRQTAHVWLFPFFALMTGMRKGEILALQWRDIDLEAGLIRVTKSVCHEGDRPIIKEPKTKKGTRVVPILAPLRAELEKADKHPLDAFIFSDDGTKPLTNRRYITLYDSYKEQTGIKCTAHQLRHSFATIAFECGVPVKSVQEILGHKNIQTTMDLYTDFREQALTEAAALLNEKLSIGKGQTGS
jgi:integrase